MHISIPDPELASRFASENALAENYGAALGRVLARRVSELVAAPNVGDVLMMPQFRALQLQDAGAGLISFNVTPPWRMIIKSAHNESSVPASRGLDWSSVTRISIVELVNQTSATKH